MRHARALPAVQTIIVQHARHACPALKLCCPPTCAMHSSPPCLRRFISADYTKLGSFGTALDFASGVINKMDNSYVLRLPEWRRAKEGPVQVGAALLDAASVLWVGAAGLSLAGVAAAAAAAHCLFLRSLTTVPYPRCRFLSPNNRKPPPASLTPASRTHMWMHFAPSAPAGGHPA